MFHKKSTANFITGIFAILMIAQIFGFLVSNIESNRADAKTDEELQTGYQDRNPLGKLQIKIPGLEKLSDEHPVTCSGGKCSIPWIGIYITAIYNYAIGSVGILATVVLMFAGILWVTAAGNTEQISKAKSYITASLTGLVLALTSWIILYQVNPDLTSLKPINMVPIGEKPPEKTTSANPVCCLFPSQQNSQVMQCQNVATAHACDVNFHGTAYSNQSCILNQSSWSCGSFVTSAQKETKVIESDFEAREEIKSYGYKINKTCNSYANQTSGTCLNDLPIKAIVGLKTIKDKVNAEIWITGGTETTGHTSHGPGKPIVDLRICESECPEKGKNTALLNYMKEQVGEIPYDKDVKTPSKDGKLLVTKERNPDGSEHFHIVFK